MKFESPPSLDDPAPHEAWQEIESALDELARLAKNELSPAAFHSRLLERLTGILAAVGGVVWSVGRDRRPGIECQLHLDQSLAGEASELARHQRLAQTVAHSGEPRLVPPAFRDAQVANASPWLAMLCPIAVDGTPQYVLELFQRPDGRRAVEEGYLRLLRTACDLAEQFHMARSLRELKAGNQALAELVEFTAFIRQRPDLPGVAAAIANESRRLLACDRVTVLIRRGRKAKVAAVSGVESFDRRSDVVRGLEAVALAAIASDEPLCFPAASDDLPDELAAQLQSLLDASHARGLLLVPLVSGADEAAQTVGLLAIEQFGQEIEPSLQQRAMSLAAASGPALDQAIQYDAIPLRSVLTWWSAVLGLAPGSRWSPALSAAALLTLLVVVLFLIPADLTVEARGKLMPARRQHVFAPSDAVVVELDQAGGDEVRAGQRLARLHSPELDIVHSELIGKQRTVQEDLLAAETELLRSESNGSATTSRSQLAGRVQQLKEELRGLEAQLQIVRQQLAELDVTSPLAGTVITWDTQRQLAGRPVKRGDRLLTIADLNGPWELLLDVPDGRSGPILAAHRAKSDLDVSFQIGTDPGRVRRASVRSLSPATELSDELTPSVEVVAAVPDAEKLSLRPGATAVGRVHCGRRSLGYVWLHELWEAIRLKLFV